MSDPRYPIGKFIYDGPPTEQQRNEFINHIEQTPARLPIAKVVGRYDKLFIMCQRAI